MILKEKGIRLAKRIREKRKATNENEDVGSNKSERNTASYKEEDPFQSGFAFFPETNVSSDVNSDDDDLKIEGLEHVLEERKNTNDHLEMHEMMTPFMSTLSSTRVWFIRCVYLFLSWFGLSLTNESADIHSNNGELSAPKRREDENTEIKSVEMKGNIILSRAREHL